MLDQAAQKLILKQLMSYSFCLCILNNLARRPNIGVNRYIDRIYLYYFGTVSADSLLLLYAL